MPPAPLKQSLPPPCSPCALGPCLAPSVPSCTAPDVSIDPSTGFPPKAHRCARLAFSENEGTERKPVLSFGFFPGSSSSAKAGKLHLPTSHANLPTSYFTSQLFMTTSRELNHLPTFHANFLRVSPANFSCQLHLPTFSTVMAPANLWQLFDGYFTSQLLMSTCRALSYYPESTS